MTLSGRLPIIEDERSRPVAGSQSSSRAGPSRQKCPVGRERLAVLGSKLRVAVARVEGQHADVAALYAETHTPFLHRKLHSVTHGPNAAVRVGRRAQH